MFAHTYVVSCSTALTCSLSSFFFFFFNDTATTEIYTLSLHDALPICSGAGSASRRTRRSRARWRRRARAEAACYSWPASTRYVAFSRARASTAMISVRPPIAPASHRHDAVLAPWAVDPFGAGHLERSDQRRSGGARIDDVVDEGGAGGDVGADELAELLDLLRALGVRIGGGGDLLAEDDVGPALRPHDTDLRRRPAHDEIRLVGAAAHHEVAGAVRLAHHHRQLGHRGLAYRIEHLGAVPDDAGALDLAADHEAGHVLEEHQRNAERVAQHDEARGLVGGVDVERAPEHHRLVGDDADGTAVQPRERHH